MKNQINAKNRISIVMPVYNAEEHIREAIESILRQSFPDFELIIVDDGSTDNTLSVIERFTDNRIRILKGEHSFIDSLNRGLTNATGTYIARMDADDVMHIDRLKVQYCLMESDSSLTVCGSEMRLFGEISRGQTANMLHGWIKYPLPELLKGNIIAHPTVMMRKSFLEKHNLCYENYFHAEDYKLWFEIAKRGGTFYVEPQPLLYYRISKNQISSRKHLEQQATSLQIREEIAEHLIARNRECYPEVEEFYRSLVKLRNKDLVSPDFVYSGISSLFESNIHFFETE